MVPKIVARGQHESTLFAKVDGVGASAEIETAAIAHFDECEFVAVEHDQVDFADPRPIVAREGSKSTPIQKAFCRALDARADFSRAGALTAPR